MKLKLTDTVIKKIEYPDKIQKLSDGAGLFLYINPTGKKSWYYLYRLNGKQKKFLIGQYPRISLKEARSIRQQARDLVEQGIDPGVARKDDETRAKLYLFIDVAEDWFNLYKIDHADKSVSIYRNILDSHVFPKIGDLPIKDIRRTQLIDLIKNNTIFKVTKDRSQTEGKMAASTAQKTCYCLGMIFRYALNLGVIEYSVATQLSTVLPDPGYSNQSTVIKHDEVKSLIEAIRSPEYASTSVWYFLNIMQYVFVRNTELRLAKWDEIDFETAEWHIPGNRMKGKKIDQDSRPPHFVPLAKQVIILLKEMKQLSTSDYLFPSFYNRNRAISDSAPLIALKRFGFRQTVHGFRTIASTYLHTLNYPSHIIEAQMAHKDDNKIRATYNKADYKEERIKMMQEWADYLDNLVNT